MIIASDRFHTHFQQTLFVSSLILLLHQLSYIQLHFYSILFELCSQALYFMGYWRRGITTPGSSHAEFIETFCEKYKIYIPSKSAYLPRNLGTIEF